MASASSLDESLSSIEETPVVGHTLEVTSIVASMLWLIK